MNGLLRHYRIYERQKAENAATVAAKVIAQYPTQQDTVRVSTRGPSRRIWGMIRQACYTAYKETYLPGPARNTCSRVMPV